MYRGKLVWGVRGNPDYVYPGAILPMRKPGTGFKFQVKVIEVLREVHDQVEAYTEHVRKWGESSRPTGQPQDGLPTAVKRIVPDGDALF
jgi:hypothetical protein